jgi:Spy/CpxP family protein refolding chaperone
MKKFIAIASAVIFFAGAAQAQDSTKHRQHDHAVKGGQRFSKEIGLTEAQKAEFKTQNEAFRTQAKAIRDNQALSQDQKKTQLETLRKQQHEKMQSILTAEQKEKLKASAKENKGKFAGKEGREKGKGKRDLKGAKGMKNGPDVTKLKEKLNLTDAQVSKIKANQTDFKSKADAIKSNAQLSEEQKKEQFKALAEQRKENIKSILTAEQLEKMKSAKKSKREAK